MNVLVVNSGSSSIKYQLFDLNRGRVLAAGLVERIGEMTSHAVQHIYDAADGSSEREQTLPIPDHRAGLTLIIESLKSAGALRDESQLGAIGHRVVHGGKFGAPVLIDDAVVAEIRATIPLAPLHNGPNLTGIELAREVFPHVPQVAVFDTAFHHTMPPHAYTYPLPRALTEKHHIRRYGFHGTSHACVSKKAAEHLGRPLADLKLISLHLGNGASAAAILSGKSVDTSMGFTPLEGLMMGTRCGTIDPEIPLYLMQTAGLSAPDVEKLLNQQSGLKGICGANDMREVERLAAAGNADASLAFGMFCYRIRKQIGAYVAALGGLDALVFTAGIGEHSAAVRARSCEGLACLGISLDASRNAAASHGLHEIQADSSAVKVLVIPTDEELEIARLTVECVNARSTS